MAGKWLRFREVEMRHFAQAFIIIVGFGAAMIAFAAERSSAPALSCTQMTSAAVPTICQ